jgi:hypothetical protein
VIFLTQFRRRLAWKTSGFRLSTNEAFKQKKVCHSTTSSSCTTWIKSRPLWTCSTREFVFRTSGWSFESKKMLIRMNFWSFCKASTLQRTTNEGKTKMSILRPMRLRPRPDSLKLKYLRLLSGFEAVVINQGVKFAQICSNLLKFAQIWDIFNLIQMQTFFICPFICQSRFVQVIFAQIVQVIFAHTVV